MYGTVGFWEARSVKKFSPAVSADATSGMSKGEKAILRNGFRRMENHSVQSHPEKKAAGLDNFKHPSAIFRCTATYREDARGWATFSQSVNTHKGRLARRVIHQAEARADFMTNDSTPRCYQNHHFTAYSEQRNNDSEGDHSFNDEIGASSNDGDCGSDWETESGTGSFDYNGAPSDGFHDFPQGKVNGSPHQRSTPPESGNAERTEWKRNMQPSSLGRADISDSPGRIHTTAPLGNEHPTQDFTDRLLLVEKMSQNVLGNISRTWRNGGTRRVEAKENEKRTDSTCPESQQGRVRIEQRSLVDFDDPGRDVNKVKGRSSHHRVQDLAKIARELSEDSKQVLLKKDGTTTEEEAQSSFEDELASARAAALRDERKAPETHIWTALDRQQAAPSGNSSPRLQIPITSHVPIYPSSARAVTSSNFGTPAGRNFDSSEFTHDMLMHYPQVPTEELRNRGLSPIRSHDTPGDVSESLSNITGPNLSRRSASVHSPLSSDIDISARRTRAYRAIERATKNKTSSANPHRKAMSFNNITISQDRTAAIEVQEKTLLRRAMNGPLQQTTDKQDNQSALKYSVNDREQVIVETGHRNDDRRGPRHYITEQTFHKSEQRRYTNPRYEYTRSVRAPVLHREDRGGATQYYYS